MDAGVCIQAHDRAGLERLLHYCARPPFAMDRLRKVGAALVYRCAIQHSEPSSDKRGARVDELHLTPLATTPAESSCTCGGQMRIIAFITHSADIWQIREHIAAEAEPLKIFPARGPPLWEDCDAEVGEGADGEPVWDMAAQPAPDYEMDQRVNW